MPMPFPMLLLPAICLVATQVQAQPQPHIAFDALHHDFGKIGGDTKVSHRFKVSNQGDANLNISRLNPSCGCTSRCSASGPWAPAKAPRSK